MTELLSSGNLLLEWTSLSNFLELGFNMFEGMVVTRTRYYKVDLEQGKVNDKRIVQNHAVGHTCNHNTKQKHQPSEASLSYVEAGDQSGLHMILSKTKIESLLDMVKV